jgi:hypothetical protein
LAIRRWTPDRIETALAIFRAHHSYPDALAAVQDAVGFLVSDTGLAKAFARNRLNPPSSYLGVAARKQSGTSVSRVTAADYEPILAAQRAAVEAGTLLADLRQRVEPFEPETPDPYCEHVRVVSDGGVAQGGQQPDPGNDPPWRSPMPDGHRHRGNSTLFAEGAISSQWVKTERDSADPPVLPVVPAGHRVAKVSTLLDSQGQVRGQWVQAPKDKGASLDDFWAACERSAAAYKGLADATPKPVATEAELLTVYPLGDPHIGMLSWAKETSVNFDLSIAARELYGTVDMLLERAPRSAIGVLANLGDFFHAEGDDQRTPTSGAKLDVDSRWGKVTEAGFTLMRRAVDRMLTRHAEVWVVNVPGNHDPKMARMLAMWMAAVYERDSRVKVLDNQNPYIYVTHGQNLIGFAHGDGAKIEQLPAIMATDRAPDWGTTRYRTWLTGHIHHMTRKEYPGCIVESFRTLAPRDYWHHHRGYRTGQSLSCITYHREWGEITRSTVDLRLTRDAKGAA